jgi:deazaflavin-dependent oxidoreductase (nitroreductase family)
MPSDFTFKAANAMHKAIQRLSGGRMGWSGFGMPVLELTTIGRKSGQPRSVMLTSPIRDGEAIVIVASAGGNDTHPAWLLNVRDNPDVEVVYKGEAKKKMKARVATADERARLWPEITSKYKNYGDYQKKSSREIPLVLLTPA